MTITKKTMLLKKRVTVERLTANVGEIDTSLRLYGARNVEAVTGYDAENHYLTAEIVVNGTSSGSSSFMIDESGEVFSTSTDIQSGDEVKVILHVDPAKTAYDQTPAEAVTTAKPW